MTLVAACNDGGTNALACSPPNALPICFGKDSFRRHRNAALALGMALKVLTLPRVGRDIDRPDDLLALIEQPSATRTHAYLSDSGIARRLRDLCAHPPLCARARFIAFSGDASSALYQQG